MSNRRDDYAVLIKARDATIVKYKLYLTMRQVIIMI